MRPGEKLYEELLNKHSKTLPTYHQKIMIATEEDLEITNINQDILDLIGLAKNLEDELDLISSSAVSQIQIASLFSSFSPFISISPSIFMI